MNISRKCDFGYAKRHLIITLILSVIMLSMSLAIYFLGIHIKGDNKNLLTLVAVLGMLPAGKEIVNLIMCFKASKFACDEVINKEITDITNNVEKIYIRYDLYITSYDVSFPVEAITCFDDSLVGYSGYDKFNHKKFEEHVKLLLSQNGLSVSNIKIFDNKNKFYERLAAFENSDKFVSEKDCKVIRLMENLSL